MGSLAWIMIIVVVIGLICIGITPKASVDPAASWNCDTCGADNASNAPQCDECGMDRPA